MFNRRHLFVAFALLFTQSFFVSVQATLRSDVLSWSSSDCLKKFKKEVKKRAPSSAEIRELWAALPSSKHADLEVDFAELLFEYRFDSLSGGDIYLIASHYYYFSSIKKYWNTFIKSVKVKTLTPQDIELALPYNYSTPDQILIKQMLAAPGVAQNKSLYYYLKAWDVINSYDENQVSELFPLNDLAVTLAALSDRQISSLIECGPFYIAVPQQLFKRAESFLKLITPANVSRLGKFIKSGFNYSHCWEDAVKKDCFVSFVKGLKGQKQAWDPESESWKTINPGLFSFVDTVIFTNLYTYSSYFDNDIKKEIVVYILENFTPLASQDFRSFYALVPAAERKSEWKKRLIKESVLIGLFVQTGKVPNIKSPLFSSYIENNFDTIDYTLSSVYTNTNKMTALEKQMKALNAFIDQEYKADNIVFFHGQQSQWSFIEYWAEELDALYWGRTPDHSQVRLRFGPDAGLTDAEVKKVRANGVTWQTYSLYRNLVLFVNLHPLANYVGSNSLLYVFNDIPKPVGAYTSNGFDVYLKNAFEAYGFGWLYQTLIKQKASVFETIFTTYDKAVEEGARMGRLILISLPKHLARELAYSSCSGAPLNPFLINGKYTTDVVEIAENFDQVTFANEYCIILSKTMCDPIAAKEAGIKIHAFDTIDRASQSYKQFEAQVKTVMQQVKQLCAQKEQ